MKILVGYDGSNTSMEAVDLARHHAEYTKAHVIVVTMIAQAHDIDTQDMDAMESADQKLGHLKAVLDAKGISCETRLVVTGQSPGEALVAFGRDQGVGLMVMGVRKRSKVGKLMFGSTAQYVILEAACPVLTVK
jgi:nucleotide-binding universal stress UspA family protein